MKTPIRHSLQHRAKVAQRRVTKKKVRVALKQFKKGISRFTEAGLFKYETWEWSIDSEWVIAARYLRRTTDLSVEIDLIPNVANRIHISISWADL